MTLNAGNYDFYVNAKDIRLVNLTPCALLRVYKFTKSNGKLLEGIDCPHVLCLIYRLETSSKDNNGLSQGWLKVMEEMNKTWLMKGTSSRGTIFIAKDVFNDAE